MLSPSALPAVSPPVDLPRIAVRKRDSSKRDYGRVLVVGGAAGMAGAPALAAMAALRSGAGLVDLAAPEGVATIAASFDQTMLSVFIPTAPNPTTGWYAVVPETSVRDLDLSVEDAFRTIISAGIVNPDERETPASRSFSSLLAQLRAPAYSPLPSNKA